MPKVHTHESGIPAPADPTRHNPERGIMNQLVGKCCGMAFGVVEGLNPWHSNQVIPLHVTRTISTFPDVGVRVSKEQIRRFNPLDVGSGFLLQCGEMLWQSVALFRVENGILFEKRNLPLQLLTVVCFLGRVERRSVDNGRTLLPFPDVSAEFLGLLECQPKDTIEVPLQELDVHLEWAANNCGSRTS